HQLIEGSAGAAIAALFKRKKTLIGKRVVIIICGGNINSNTLHKVLS
ncbi:MAG: serine/threonine dehydratase, partial [Candidatus Marinimicrobia bacterium]|nr:serine/threonine dehydratase [Candidatus Neomarinimicrobiota bacterium]